MNYKWTEDEIALTRHAWWLVDTCEKLDRRKKMREIVYTHLAAWLIVAVLCLALI